MKRRSPHPQKTKASSSRARKKSPTQLDHEIAESLARRARPVAKSRHHASIKSEAESTAPLSLEEFAKVTIEAAKKVPKAGRFSDERIFISSTWLKLPFKVAEQIGSLDTFKVRLVEAMRAGLIRLARADLVVAMNKQLVAASLISLFGGAATFHFIIID